jgi:predicted ArsR family transcriptional regulator
MAKEAAERRKKIVALLLARGEEMSPQAIKAEIPMNPGQAQADFRKLAEEGHIRRNGPQTRPTYEAIVKPPTPTLAATAEPQGRAGRTAPVLDDDGSTVGGRMLAYISATGGATRDGLIEHLGLTGEIAEQEIGKLLREGDVRYERRGGITFLVEEPNV